MITALIVMTVIIIIFIIANTLLIIVTMSTRHLRPVLSVERNFPIDQNVS